MFIDAFIHWLHLMAAIIWIGGTIFASVALQPALIALFEPAQRMPIYRAIGQRFKAIQLACLAVLFMTGFVKLWALRDVPDIFYGPFGIILFIKLCLVIAVSFLTFLHSFFWGPQLTSLRLESETALYRKILERLYFWGRLNLVLSAGIIFCAALLRFNPF